MIKLAHPPLTSFFKAYYQFNAVHNLNPLLAGPAGLYGSHFGDKTPLFNPPVNREQSCGTLRMFRSRVVEQKPFVIQKPSPSHCAVGHPEILPYLLIYHTLLQIPSLWTAFTLLLNSTLIHELIKK